MGYRSDVYIKCRKKMYKEIMDIIDDNNSLFYPDDIIEHEIAETENENLREYTIIWKDVKWYEQYKEVGAIEELLEKHERDESPEYLYRMFIIGEELDDIEERYNDMNFEIDLYIVRRVECGSGKSIV